MKRVLKNILVTPYRIAVVLLLCKFTLMAQTPPSLEYQVKAVFLFNFTQFIDWPTTSFASDDSPLVIGVLGNNPFGTFLDQAVSGEMKNGHPVVVRYLQNEEEALQCHILFVNIKDPDERKAVLDDVKGKNILTVGDVANFATEGGIVGFLTRSKKIKFQINVAACKEAGLEPSSKLLRLAEIIGSPETN